MDRLVIWALFCFQRWGERRCFFCGREGSSFGSRGNEALLLARGRGAFLDFGNWPFFQQEEERNVLVFCGREGWLLLAGGRRFAPPSFLSFGDVSFSRQGRVASFGRREWGLSGYPASLYPFLFGFPFRFPFHFHSFYCFLACGACSGREGESLWSEGTAVGFLFSSFVFILLPFHPSLASLPWPRFLFCIPPCRDVVWRVGMRVWTLWSHGSGMAKEL